MKRNERRRRRKIREKSLLLLCSSRNFSCFSFLIFISCWSKFSPSLSIRQVETSLSSKCRSRHYQSEIHPNWTENKKKISQFSFLLTLFFFSWMNEWKKFLLINVIMQCFVHHFDLWVIFDLKSTTKKSTSKNFFWKFFFFFKF